MPYILEMPLSLKLVSSHILTNFILKEALFSVIITFIKAKAVMPLYIKNGIITQIGVFAHFNTHYQVGTFIAVYSGDVKMVWFWFLGRRLVVSRHTIRWGLL